MRNSCIFLLVFALLLFSCNKRNEQSPFQVLSAKQTGIDFSNRLTPTPDFNLFTYMYYYNGAGVAAGDFNNDGLIDLFFAANQANNKLYINKGGLQFQDVTTDARIPQDGGWNTGVSVVDINNDGLLDLYICRVGQYKLLKGKNQLLVCKGISKEGIPLYADEAAAYGLDFSGFSTQAAFFDYDMDGDLDLFLLNHSVNHDGNYAPRANFLNTYDSTAGHRFYRNDRVITNSSNPQTYFTDVTKQSGINSSRIGYGLGVVVSDINNDGWPDLYVGNDFHENDYLYINQQNGTFIDETQKQLMHTSQFSMGVDAADITNDGFADIISADMLPDDPYMLKRSLAEDDYVIFQQKLAYGYHYQYARNNLQWNKGNGKFTEAGQYANVFATDWSWAPLWFDFDNDGLKDLFVSNGIPKRMNDIDYVNFVTNDELQQKLRSNTLAANELKLVDQFPEIKLPNRFFRNNGNLSFTDLTDSITDNPITFSNGTVYADLDNDGDLDLVVNNINDAAVVYENKTNNTLAKSFASVLLTGDRSNKNAIGAKLLLYVGKELRSYEQYPVHGFLSSMMLPLHIGLANTTIDSALLIWPDRTYQHITLTADTINRVSYKRGLPVFDYTRFQQTNNNISFEDIIIQSRLAATHIENRFNEFDREPLLPHMVSTEGPAVAVADINGDGLEDIFIGSSKTYHPTVWLQNSDGTFTEKKQTAIVQDSMWEHVDAVWTDVNNDRFPDLVIATGGNEYYGDDVHLLPLLYLNDGKGNLTRKQDAFANINITQSVVKPFDLNGDGAMDLFIGGRAVPWNYGAIPRSYLLLNDGTGTFRDVTKTYCPALLNPGMVTSATWVDINADQRSDLVLSYEWGGIDVFVWKNNQLQQNNIAAQKGWWNAVIPFDADGDGDFDLLALNYGYNIKLKPTVQQPVRLYHADFDGNGRNEQLLTYYLGKKEIPFANKMDLEKQLPGLKKKFLLAADFAKADLADLFGRDQLTNADQLTVTDFSHYLFINDGNMQFSAVQLPWQTQLHTWRTAAVTDIDGNGLPDLLLGGNYYDNHVQLGRNDGDFGSVLINTGHANFRFANLQPATDMKQVRSIKPVRIAGKQVFLLARNNASASLISLKKPAQ